MSKKNARYYSQDYSVMFVLYVSDLEDWLQHSSSLTYADDTTTRVFDKDLDVVKRKME